MTRILVVEDEALLRELLCEEIADLGYAVVEAVNGADALEVSARERPDLVLCDNAMPVMSGLAFVRALRERDGDAAPPVIMVSAFSCEGDLAAARAAGVADYCAKPVDFDRLSAVIEANL